MDAPDYGKQVNFADGPDYGKQVNFTGGRECGEQVNFADGPDYGRHCCKVSDEAAFCLIQRPYISKTLLTRRISPRGSP